MTPDDTEHGTRDAERVLRSAVPPQATNSVPYPRDFWESGTEHGTFSHEQGQPLGVPQNAQNGSDPDPLTVPSPAQDIVPSRPRNTTAVVPQNTGTVPPDSQNDDAIVPQNTGTVPQNGAEVSRWRPAALSRWAQNAYQRRQDSIRSTRDARAVAARNAERDEQYTKDALARESTVRRRRGGPATATADTIAPIPAWMSVAQVWFERVGGTVLKLSPLAVSGYFTYDVGREDPLNMNAFTAFFLVGGLEGSVWYLNRLREKFKLENDSTLSISAMIGFIIVLIFALIGGHAIWKSAGAVPIWIDLLFTDRRVPLEELVPAIAIGLMSAIGAFIWAKEATYKHRAKLRALNQLDPRAPRISAGAWTFTWWESIWSLRHAFKFRITSAPTEDWRHWKAAGKPKIWPVPDGFRWEPGTLFVPGKIVPVPLEELRNMAERDVLLAEITGHRSAEQRYAEQRDTPAITGRVPSERSALPRGTGGATGTEHGTAGDGTSRAGHGTQNVERHGTQNTGDGYDANGTGDSDNGTAGAGSDGTQDTDGTQNVPQNTGGTNDDQVAIDAKLLKKADLAMIAMDWFDGSTKERRHWRTAAKAPSAREINAVIDAHRKRTEGPEGGFNSLGIANMAAQLIVRIRQQPALEDVVRLKAFGSDEN